MGLLILTSPVTVFDQARGSTCEMMPVGMANQTGTVQRFIERRWVLVPLALMIGLASSYLLYVTLFRDYFDYWILPKVKDAYIYPQLRYTFFDAVLILWCLDGLVACIMCVHSATASRSITGWPLRTLTVYFVLFVVLVVGGSLMLAARHHGY
jgi:hypothetical protein